MGSGYFGAIYFGEYSAGLAAQPVLIQIDGEYVPLVSLSGEYTPTVTVSGEYVPTVTITGEWGE
jgi:hypothetical protein